MPKTMSGIVIEANGGPEVLQWKTDLPVPELKEGEVLVKNEYVGVNFIDTCVLLSDSPLPMSLLPGN
jgi:NADPH2:quinone reductase